MARSSSGRRPAAHVADVPQPGSFDLSDDEQISLHVPTGCAHGFQPITEIADIAYSIDRARDPDEDVSIAFDDLSWLSAGRFLRRPC
jgi:dTDP-4-dehydrorhamnose 3,5-epimerase